MWVFGYGSLMWDGWERSFECRERVQATLPGFRRDFSKSSVRNWGTTDEPCPTLGLAEDPETGCLGVAFSFDRVMEGRILEYLAKREGRSFMIEPMEVLLADGIRYTALVPVNDKLAPTFIGDWSLADRVSLAKVARGTRGTCFEYVDGLREALADMGIADPAVEKFWAKLSGN